MRADKESKGDTIITELFAYLTARRLYTLLLGILLLALFIAGFFAIREAEGDYITLFTVLAVLLAALALLTSAYDKSAPNLVEGGDSSADLAKLLGIISESVQAIASRKEGLASRNRDDRLAVRLAALIVGLIIIGYYLRLRKRCGRS
jgi:hypothetical protein